MKKILFCTFVSLLFLSGVSAQNFVTDKYSDLKGEEDVLSISVQSRMFELISQVEIEDESGDFQDFQEFIESVETFNMIMTENDDLAPVRFQDGLVSAAQIYEELMTVSNKEGDFHFFIDNQKNTIRELVMVAQKDDRFLAFSLSGWMDLDQIAQLAEEINIEGFEELNEMKKIEAEDFQVYPNPISQGSLLYIDVPASLDGQTAQLLSANGNIAQTTILRKGQTTLQLNSTLQGNYVLQVVKDGVTLRKKVIILQ